MMKPHILDYLLSLKRQQKQSSKKRLSATTSRSLWAAVGRESGVLDHRRRPHRPARCPRHRARYAKSTPNGQRTRIHLESPSRMGYRGGLGVYSARATLAEWVHRILQRQILGRMSQCQPVLLSKPCQRHHRDLEGGLQHDPAAFITGVFGPRGLCSTVHPLKPVTTLKVT